MLQLSHPHENCTWEAIPHSTFGYFSCMKNDTRLLLFLDFLFSVLSSYFHSEILCHCLLCHSAFLNRFFHSSPFLMYSGHNFGEVNNEHCLLSDHVTVLRVESHSSWPCAFLQGPSAYLMNRGTGGLCSRWSFQGCTYVVNSLGRYQWCFSPGQKTSLYTV